MPDADNRPEGTRIPGPADPGQPASSWGTVTAVGELAGGQRHGPQGDPAGGQLFRPELLTDPRCAILAYRRDGDLVAGIITFAAAGVRTRAVTDPAVTSA